MLVNNLIAVRRLSQETRLSLEIHFARAFEALAETYCIQAVEFVRRLRMRMPVEESLDRYFREVGVPAAMEETVRARALITIGPLTGSIREPETRAGLGWNPLRPDQILETIRRRAHDSEEIGLDCRMAASVSAEAVGATHLAMALGTAEVLEGEYSPEEAIMHYIRYFNLPSVEAQIILRRALAQLAAREDYLPNTLFERSVSGSAWRGSTVTFRTGLALRTR
ncbi:MAG: hypothetical protein ACREL3_07385 [Gemmatimonadales bacterium]